MISELLLRKLPRPVSTVRVVDSVDGCSCLATVAPVGSMLWRAGELTFVECISRMRRNVLVSEANMLHSEFHVFLLYEWEQNHKPKIVQSTFNQSNLEEHIGTASGHWRH